MGATITDLGLRRLPPPPPETWGQRMARARSEADLTVRDVEDLLPAWLSRTTVSEMEKLNGPPARSKGRMLAFLLLVTYGVDPTDFGLGPEDAPPAVDLRVIRNMADRLSSAKQEERRRRHDGFIHPDSAGVKKRLAGAARTQDEHQSSCIPVGAAEAA